MHLWSFWMICCSFLIGSFVNFAGVKEDHWAYQPVIDPEVPSTDNNDWVNNEIDAFIFIGVNGFKSIHA